MAVELTTVSVETSIADGDEFYFNDVSETPDALNRITWANIKSVLSTYFGTTYALLAGSVSQVFSASTIELGHASDTTLSRASAGNLAVEGNVVYRAGGTDVPVTDGGTGASSASAAATNLGLGTGDSPQFTAINLGHASDTTVTRSAAGVIAVEGVDQVGTTSTQTLSAKKIQLNAALGTDDTYEGIHITGKNAAGSIAQWEPVYLNSSGKWDPSDAGSDTTMPCAGLAVAAGTLDNPLTVLVHGIVRNDAWAWTTGSDLYILNGGGLSHTAPSTGGDFVQRVGYAISADIAFFDFNSTLVELA